MSGYILCQVSRAEVPYYIESISTNIYSIEELCYFSHHNIYLLDGNILNDTLRQWLKDELGLNQLYQKLQPVVEKREPGIREYVYPVFKEINYLSYEDMKEYENQVAALELESIPVRRKMKGDTLIENGMYVNALKVYQEILQTYEQDSEVKDRFLGGVYHNMGCAYSYLFQKEEALECFEKAYQKIHSGAALRSYLYAYYNAKTPIEYMSKLSELGVDEETSREIQKNIDGIQNGDQPTILDHQIDGMLEDMIKSYHRSTGS